MGTLHTHWSLREASLGGHAFHLCPVFTGLGDLEDCELEDASLTPKAWSLKKGLYRAKAVKALRLPRFQKAATLSPSAIRKTRQKLL